LVNTKLILVEGLPGSGKSTTAQLINDILKENKEDPQLFLEGNVEHPADYEACSYFSKEEFADLLEQYSDLRPILIRHAVEQTEGFILSWYMLRQEVGESSFPETLQKKLWEHDIYELPLEKNIELITKNWKKFCDTARKNDQTYIFECCFIQNPVTIGTVKYGASDEAVMEYVNRLAKIIEPLNPILIYIDQKDLRRSFTKAVQERSKEWSEGFMDYYTNQGYGKKHGAEGMEGVLSVLEARNQLESKIFEALNMEKFKIDNSEFNRDHHKARLIEKLKF
jgi:adenylate kinase family enzyme